MGMKNVAVQLPWESEQQAGALDLQPINTDVCSPRHPARFLALIGVLIALQILDGALTLAGMHTFGLSAEGNPLLRTLMNSLGLIPGLVATKLFLSLIHI